MLEPAAISAGYWAGFIISILFFLALDLGVFHKHAHVVRVKEALVWTGIWFLLALGFAVLLECKRGREESLEFVTGYLIELSLSMDNVFVIALIFSYFQVPSRLQHRVLFWGIIGALIMRGLMIGVGAALIAHAHWVLYLFGVFLVYTGCKMVIIKEEGVHPEKNPLIKLARGFCRISGDYAGQHFVTTVNGQRTLTPLMLVLIMVETTDLVFALDSIPAIFAVTEKAFIVFTSNVFAILGLRSLYFVLAGAIAYFRYLRVGLAIVLVFIGLKMLLARHHPIPTGWSLAVVAIIIFSSILLSIGMTWHQNRDRT